jgi:hypothetical protein
MVREQWDYHWHYFDWLAGRGWKALECGWETDPEARHRMEYEAMESAMRWRGGWANREWEPRRVPPWERAKVVMFRMKETGGGIAARKALEGDRRYGGYVRSLKLILSHLRPLRSPRDTMHCYRRVRSLVRDAGDIGDMEGGEETDRDESSIESSSSNPEAGTLADDLSTDSSSHSADDDLPAGLTCCDCLRRWRGGGIVRRLMGWHDDSSVLE